MNKIFKILFILTFLPLMVIIGFTQGCFKFYSK